MSSWSSNRRAEDDLLDIYVHSVEAFGRRQAVEYIHGFEHVFELLASNPRMGRRAETIAPNVRRHEHGRHVILYEEIPDGVLILAVVHANSMRRLRL
ncbi:type II toxin-antitoxin system RelE/ParE family toxin [Aureimonas leprariae]|uniref:Type II toxin-antitoxin system RelE/ParE family toxin n=1 Tax=Plantimonas leprariae TaxID=2615207 RepID=A0A7V7TX57_9HYPH|nr:type II toxin-antitoxin system RelE/ParE family toxin [Aureimonas leprariae]KAB0680733.1 type II toxin-antitoxin system RelE/ParE family toxin [Aureimonas leprariae]